MKSNPVHIQIVSIGALKKRVARIDKKIKAAIELENKNPHSNRSREKEISELISRKRKIESSIHMLWAAKQ